jgi:glyoxylase-like metal-dependent hydrolase (beta-lactamase superfamily II)
MGLIKARLLPRLALLLATICLAAGAQAVPLVEQLAPGVYLARGEMAPAEPGNRGVVGNVGILVGSSGIILVDTGTSARYMRELLAEIGKITPLPVVLAINTHQHPAHVFGNSTLDAMGVPILAHQDAAQLIGERCERCLKQLVQALGSEEMAGTVVTRPTRTITESTSMNVGGRDIALLYFGSSSSPGAIAVHDRASGVLFGGGMVSIDAIPDAKDADIGKWREALRRIEALAPKQVVPDSGPAVSVSRLPELDAYLTALQPAVQAAFDRHVGLAEAAGAAALPAYREWAMYDSMHRKNVEALYLRLERARMDKP